MSEPARKIALKRNAGRALRVFGQASLEGDAAMTCHPRPLRGQNRGRRCAATRLFAPLRGSLATPPDAGRRSWPRAHSKTRVAVPRRPGSPTPHPLPRPWGRCLHVCRLRGRPPPRPRPWGTRRLGLEASPHLRRRPIALAHGVRSGGCAPASRLPLRLAWSARQTRLTALG